MRAVRIYPVIRVTRFCVGDCPLRIVLGHGPLNSSDLTIRQYGDFGQCKVSLAFDFSPPWYTAFRIWNWDLTRIHAGGSAIALASQIFEFRYEDVLLTHRHHLVTVFGTGRQCEQRAIVDKKRVTAWRNDPQYQLYLYSPFIRWFATDWTPIESPRDPDLVVRWRREFVYLVAIPAIHHRFIPARRRWSPGRALLPRAPWNRLNSPAWTGESRDVFKCDGNRIKWNPLKERPMTFYSLEKHESQPHNSMFLGYTIFIRMPAHSVFSIHWTIE